MKKVVVLTGAGISAESGIRTFRDMGGLWEEYDVMEVASPEGWQQNPDLVTRFYNERRAQLATVQPNAGHIALAELEKYFDLHIITQNVDDLHERAGSTQIMHLHGELTKVRSTANRDLVYDWGYKPITPQDRCAQGARLRPHIVWFGEAVPLIVEASRLAAQADIFLVIGTSLNVYPAAGLLDDVPLDAPKYLIDPHLPEVRRVRNWHMIEATATQGVPQVAKELIEKYA